MVVRSFTGDGEAGSRFCPLMACRACFEFVYDEYWNLGHGWSGDMICRDNGI